LSAVRLGRDDRTLDEVLAYGRGEGERKSDDGPGLAIEPDGVNPVVGRGPFGRRGAFVRGSVRRRHAPCFERVLK
jgi:hypothetical protein